MTIEELLNDIDKPNDFLWTIDEALEFAKLVEQIVSKLNHHIGLTGGCLYKNGKRKDIDIILYSVRQTNLNKVVVFEALEKHLGLKFIKLGEWQSKAITKDGKLIDFLIPESVKNGEENYERG